MLQLFFGKFFSKYTVWFSIISGALSLLTSVIPQLAALVNQLSPAQAIAVTAAGAALARIRGVWNEVAALIGAPTIREP